MRGTMGHHFFAMMARMKYIERWALMRNSIDENISEHSMEVAMIAHVLAVIGKKRFQKELNVEKAALIGLYHDSTEIITGDMPTPIKYYNREIMSAFKQIEDNAALKLLSMLPNDLQEEYESIFFMGESEVYLWKLVKAADKLSALIKCLEEEKTGNQEFIKARIAVENSIDAMELEEVEEFKKDFLASYRLTLDELQ